jgi:hypothetical protein
MEPKSTDHECTISSATKFMQVQAMQCSTIFFLSPILTRYLLPTSSFSSIHHTLQFLCCFYQRLAEFLGIVVLGCNAPSDVVVVDRVGETVAVFDNCL